MNRLFKYSLFPLALSLVAFFSPSESFAQTKENTLGVGGGYVSYNNGGYVNLYFHHSFSKHIRLAPEIGYIFKSKGKSAFECSVDVQFPFRIARGVNVYPLAGITVNTWSYPMNYKATKGGFDFGGGFDLYMTSSLKLTFQAKYSLMDDTSGCFAEMGIGYIF